MIIDIIVYAEPDIYVKKIKSCGPKPFLMFDDRYLFQRHYELLSLLPYSTRFWYVIPENIYLRFKKSCKLLHNKGNIICYSDNFINTVGVCKLGIANAFGDDVLLCPCGAFYNEEFVGDIAESLRLNGKSQAYFKYNKDYNSAGALIKDGKIVNMAFGLWGAFSGIVFLNKNEQTHFQNSRNHEELHEGLNLVVKKEGVIYPVYTDEVIVNICDRKTLEEARSYDRK